MSEFHEFIRSLKLRHFTAEELVEPEYSTEPPRELWHNAVGVLTVADAVREELGFPLRILSAYRNPEDNRKAGGGKRSRHQFFEALDLAPAAEIVEELEHKLVKLHTYLDVWRREGRIFALEQNISSACWRWVRRGLGEKRRNPSPRDLPPAAFRFRGGLGLYPWGVHVDTRGTNATWSGS